MRETILIISIAYAVTLIAFGFLVRYYRNEIQKEFKFGNRMFNKYYDISFRNGVVEKHNSKYSKICRRLYEENKVLQEKIAELEKGKLKEKRGKR